LGAVLDVKVPSPNLRAPKSFIQLPIVETTVSSQKIAKALHP
jgi:hypothetical protein